MNFLVLASVSYLFGILWGYYPAHYSPFLLFIPLFFILLSGTFLALSRSFNPQFRQYLSIILFSSLFLGLGSLLIRINITQIDAGPAHHLTNYLSQNLNFTKSPINIIGRLVKPPKYFYKKTQLHLAVQKIILPGQNLMTSGIIQLDWYNPKKVCQYYDTVQVKARLKLPHDYNNPGCFPYSNYLRQKGIFATGYIKNLFLITPAKNIPWFKQILRRIYQLRKNISENIERVTSGTESHLMQAILLGERQKLSKHIKSTFSEAGLAHLLSISGLHLTILAMAAFFFLKFIFHLLPDKWFEILTWFGKPINLAALSSIPFIIFYTLLTGNKISTIRASIMIIAYFFSLLLEKEKGLWQPLLLAGFCILLWQPEALFMANFQLTFLATGGILFVLKYLPHHPLVSTTRGSTRFLLRFKEYFLSSLYMSLMALFVTSPLIAYYFNLITPSGIITNLLAVPLMTIVLCLGLSSIILFQVWSAPAILLFRLEAWLCSLISRFSASAVKIPMAFFYVPSPSKIHLLIIYCIMATFLIIFCQWNPKSPLVKKNSFLIAILAGFFFLLFFCSRPSPSAIKNMQVTFLDVGKGDACFIQTPGGKNILIDGGGTYDNKFDIGRYVVAPYLWSKRVKKIDLIILSHPHPDHLHGLLFILKNFKVTQIYKTKDRSDSLGYKLFEDITRGKKIPIRHTGKGDQFIMDNILMEIFGPDELSNSLINLKTSNREENNRSLVLKISYQQVSFLFTGDIEWEAEKDLLEFGEKLQSTILKVPHHGSRNSSSDPFLQMVSPQAAIFSARKYGNLIFPHPETLARYQNLPCRIYRTDLDGAITVVTDGVNFIITSQNKT